MAHQIQAAHYAEQQCGNHVLMDVYIHSLNVQEPNERGIYTFLMVNVLSDMFTCDRSRFLTGMNTEAAVFCHLYLISVDGCFLAQLLAEFLKYYWSKHFGIMQDALQSFVFPCLFFLMFINIMYCMLPCL